MATDIAKLQVALEVQSAKFIAEMEKVNRKLSKFERQAKKTGQRVNRAFDGMSRGAKNLARAAAGLAVAFGVRGIVNVSDTYRKLEGRLKLVTTSTENLAAVQSELFKVAQETRSSYESTVELYARVARNAKQLGVSQRELLDITKSVNKAIQIGGASTQEAAAGVIQFSQALASGELRGEELRSVMENLPRLAQAIADGLGVTIGKLRDMSKAGELTAKTVFDALKTQIGVIESEFTQIPVTVGQSFTRLGNVINQAIAKGDMSPLVDSVNDLASRLSDPNLQKNLARFVGLIAKLAGFAISAAAEVGDLARRISITFGGSLGEVEALEAQLANVNKALTAIDNNSLFSRPLNTLFDSKEELQAQRKELEKQISLIKGAPKPLALNPAAPTLNTPTVDTSAAEKALKAYQRAVENARDSIEGLIQSQRQQIDTFGKSDAEVLKYRLTVGDLSDEIALLGEQGKRFVTVAVGQAEAVERLNAAYEREQQILENRRALYDEVLGIIESSKTELQRLTEQQERINAAYQQGIISLQQYAQASVAVQEGLDKIAEKTDETLIDLEAASKRAAENIQDAFADFFFDPFDEGLKGLVQGFGNALRRMAAELAAQEFLKLLFGGSSGIGGFIGSIFGGSIGARASGGPVTANAPYIVGEKGPEFFVPNSSGSIVPNHEVGGMGGNTIVMHVNTPDADSFRRNRSAVQNEMVNGLARASARNG